MKTDIIYFVVQAYNKKNQPCSPIVLFKKDKTLKEINEYFFNFFKGDLYEQICYYKVFYY